VKKIVNNGKALVIDQHTTYSLQLIRVLSRKGYAVDIFAESHSPALHSRFCRKGYPASSFRDSGAFSTAVQAVVENGAYDVIYLCSEEVLPAIMQIAPSSDRWRALPLGDASDLSVLLSKHAVLKRVAEGGGRFQERSSRRMPRKSLERS
jgi:hypothetical protein